MAQFDEMAEGMKAPTAKRDSSILRGVEQVEVNIDRLTNEISRLQSVTEKIAGGSPAPSAESNDRAGANSQLGDRLIALADALEIQVRRLSYYTESIDL